MAFPIDGMDVVDSIMAGQRPMEEAPCNHREFDDGRGVSEIEDSIVYQDMMLARALQQGMHSAGYKDSNLSGQETRSNFSMRC